ncbi:MAG: tRNA 2-thiouridine(34) synthase MnmA [Pseudomonadales bacterium]|nr:tRNA 2-thiouridine(34) synthase MnmA [Pseudomonadales bacterium]MCP5185733.1 tRNA 2-thiouridine(34) synthase MnmA [Pseudomonadales bacterium]
MNRLHQSQPAPGARVIVGMSGGVDSAVSAALLLEQGYAVQGLFMKNWDEDDGTEYCTAKADLADARAVCDQLGIELLTASFAAEYWDDVFAAFLAAYRNNLTPNPDVLCNREIKFRQFRDYALTLGADAIATGHYARLAVAEDGMPRLLKGVDTGKDQSYFLQAVTADQLRNVLFPVGGLWKREVRAIADRLGLRNRAKKDSTGICFIGERRFRDFLAQYVPPRPGPILDTEGRTRGQHHGLAYYTIGQRQGLGIGGTRDCPEAPWYVVDKVVEGDVLVVSQNVDTLLGTWLAAAEPNWISPAPALPLRCHVRIRYRQSDQAATVQARADGQLLVRFDTPQRAITPGQYVCFSLGEQVLGGATITCGGR